MYVKSTLVLINIDKHITIERNSIMFKNILSKFLTKISRQNYEDVPTREKSIFNMTDEEYRIYWKDTCDNETEILVNHLLATGNYISLGKYVNKENHNFYILTESYDLMYKDLYAVNSETIHSYLPSRLQNFYIPFISYRVDTSNLGTSKIKIFEFHTNIKRYNFKNMGYGRPLIEKLIELALKEYHVDKITGELSSVDCTDSDGIFQKELMEYRNNFYKNRGFTVICDENGNGMISMELQDTDESYKR